MDFGRSTSPTALDNEDSNSCDSEDRQEMESYLYSLVHHDPSFEDKTKEQAMEKTQPVKDPAPQDPQGSCPTKRVVQRYFNSTNNERRDKHLELLNNLGKKTFLRNIPSWQKQVPQQPGRFAFVLSDKRLNNSNTEKESNNIKNNDVSRQKECLDIRSSSLSNQDDANFELPLVAKPAPCSKSNLQRNLNDSMTEVLGSMLEEDASRSSVDSERRCGPDSNQRQRDCVKSGSATDWTVAMSWDDMAKVRFNFEVDSVCGDSVREDSTPAGSRATSPEPSTSLTPEDTMSKYDISLKNKEKCIDGLSDTLELKSDSEEGSIVEVSLPEKLPPPVVEIDSDGEDVVQSKKRKISPDMKKKTTSDIEEDIIIVFEKGNNETNHTTSNNNVTSPKTAVSQPAQSQTLQLNITKEKPRKRKMTAVSDNTRSKAKDFDLQRILAGMSDDPALWRLCREDLYPRPRIPFRHRLPPCDNCAQRDHPTSYCPEPIKIKVCHMCAAPGHEHYYCPEGMCLVCGKKPPSNISSRLGFTKVCGPCARQSDKCHICAVVGHNTRQCPDIWRRYHLTTSTGPPVVPTERVNRPSKDMWCCNCAKKGHHSHECQMPFDYGRRIVSSVLSYSDPEGNLTKVVPGPPARHDNNTPCNVEEIPTSSGGTQVPSVASVSGTSYLKTSAQELPAAGVQELPSLRRLQEDAKLPNASANLPKSREVLIEFLKEGLEQLKDPLLKGNEVNKCYLKYIQAKESNVGPKRRVKMARKALRCARMLHITLLGHYGMAQGKYHVEKLKESINTLSTQSQPWVSSKMKSDITTHYKAIFTGYARSDIGELVKSYNSLHSSTSTSTNNFDFWFNKLQNTIDHLLTVDAPLQLSQRACNLAGRLAKRPGKTVPAKLAKAITALSKSCERSV